MAMQRTQTRPRPLSRVALSFARAAESLSLALFLFLLLDTLAPARPRRPRSSASHPPGGSRHVRGFRSCGWKRCETSGRGRNRGKIIRRRGGMGFSEAHTEAKNKATEPPFFPWKVKKALGRSRRAPASRSRQKSPLLGSRRRENQRRRKT